MSMASMSATENQIQQKERYLLLCMSGVALEYTQELVIPPADIVMTFFFWLSI